MPEESEGVPGGVAPFSAHLQHRLLSPPRRVRFPQVGHWWKGRVVANTLRKESLGGALGAGVKSASQLAGTRAIPSISSASRICWAWRRSAIFRSASSRARLAAACSASRRSTTRLRKSSTSQLDARSGGVFHPNSQVVVRLGVEPSAPALEVLGVLQRTRTASGRQTTCTPHPDGCALVSTEAPRLGGFVFLAEL